MLDVQSMGQKVQAVLIAASLVVLAALGRSAAATDAPGDPGIDAFWTTGAKQGLGTSATEQSTLWYTIAEGIVTEVYYPTVDVPNVQDLQLIVTDGKTFVDLERDATTHKVELSDPQALTYRQVNTAKSNRYQITRTLVTDPDRPVLLMETRFESLSGGPYEVYVLYNPSLKGSGQGDRGATSGNALVADDDDVASALVSSSGFAKMSNGYSGDPRSDGYQDLKTNKRLTNLFDSASKPGNLVQIGQVNVGNDTTFTLALGFGRKRSEAAANAATSLAAGFAAVRNAYENGWHAYLGTLRPAPNSIFNNNLVTHYNVALMTLKALEDKTFPGAHVASLSIPWGQAVLANNCCEPGYHRVWARDLYQVATAQLAAGDSAAANRSLDYLLDHQQIKTQDEDLLPGAFPRFSRLDGSDRGCCEQLDQDAFPLILAWQLNRTDAPTWAKLKLTADHIVDKGPITLSERWEEQAGISPSTVAAEIAGLVCAADIAEKNGNTQARDEYLAKADDWQQGIEKWAFTTTGPIMDSQYYFRIDTTDNGDPRNPNDGAKIRDLKNGGGNDVDERSIVDAGFLELVRLGVKPPTDLKVAASLPEIDSTATIRVTIPNEGDMWHRYNHDGYGEQQDGTPWRVHMMGIGRLWPILSGERGEYELANGNPTRASELLKTMASAANQGFMIPEQVWDQEDMIRADGRKLVKGQGTDSAMPLAWSMAQFVRLAQSIDTGKPVETPKVVTDRYATH